MTQLLHPESNTLNHRHTRQQSPSRRTTSPDQQSHWMERDNAFKNNIRLPPPPEKRAKYYRTLKSIIRTARRLPLASVRSAFELFNQNRDEKLPIGHTVVAPSADMLRKRSSATGITLAGVAANPNSLGLTPNSGVKDGKEKDVVDHEGDDESTLETEIDEGETLVEGEDGEGDEYGGSSEVGGRLRWAVLGMSCLLMFGVLPFFGGFLLDVFGTHKLMTVLSALVCLGQILFAIGISSKKYWLMHLGRVVFGVGGESLSVAQTRITSKWFKGKEIAFALGVNLSVARLGSVMNDFISPHLAVSEGVPVAIWFGTLTCIISFVAGVVLNAIDAYGSRKLSKRKRAIPMKMVSRTRLRSPSASKAEGEGSAKKPAFDFSALFKFHLSFWLICLVMCLMFAIVVPFNTIHSAFLQSKWYPGDPKTAGQVMALPDVISAVLVPFCGTFVDRYGRRVKVLILCGSLIAFVHLVLVLGFSYSLLLTFWPCIPLVVDEKNLATAFGVATATQNASLVLFPIIVAALVNADKTFFLTEMFFVFCSSVGVAACVWLYYVDKTQLKSILERGKEELFPVKNARENVAYTSLRNDGSSEH
ncbi:major facilitator superfamily domain-containing protein [Chytridium lagenaria]|nr:major facilitator superfamily domain-containing protein [Chytridium lagenaria]